MAEKEKRERPWKHRWLDLVEEASSLPSTTRHLLLSLGRRMESNGTSCYPATRTIAARTGLSERTVCTHLALAETEGWLERSARGRGAGQAWRGHEYRPSVPPQALKEVQHVGAEGTEGGSARIGEGTEPDDRKVLKEVQSSSSKSSPTNTPEEIFQERSRYSPDQLTIIDEAIDSFRSTRKTGHIADSVILTEFRWWKTHPADHVVEGLRIYVGKGCAAAGQRESYARGIIRNCDDARVARRQQPKKSDFPDMGAGKVAFLTDRRTQSEELTQ